MRRILCSIGLCLVSACWQGSQAAAQCCGTNVQPGPRIDVQVSVELKESYGAWKRHPQNCQAWIAEYTYLADGAVQRHYIVRYQNDPNHCYCFNPDTRVYWGRWNYGGLKISFSKVAEGNRVPNRRPLQVIFEGDDRTPAAPGTNLPMTPPPTDLPPV